MHWLKAWREAHGIEREDFARLVEVSEPLIAILENQNGITHPLIADAIADYTRATPRQRDSLVHKKHHGTYVPNPRRAKPKPSKQPEVKQTWVARPVVALNIRGDIERVFGSAAEAAAAHAPCTSRTVINRCEGRVSRGTNEFALYHVTFRYADEWLSMSKEERDLEMARAAEVKKTKIHDRSETTCV